MDTPITYKSVLPAIVVEFQDNTFLDIDDIISFTVSKTNETVPIGIAILEVRIGKRPWHSVKSIIINGQPGSLISFDRHSFSFESFTDEEPEGEVGDSYAKLVVRYELSDEEMVDILSRRMMAAEMNLGEEGDNAGKDTGTVLQCSDDSAPTG